MAAQTYATCSQCLKLNKISLDKAQSKTPVCGSCGATIHVQHGVFNANTQQLQKLIQTSPLPVVVDFWAPWCAPCRAFAPTFEQVAHERAGQAVFVKVNTEENMMASQAFGVRGIPTLVAFRAGLELNRQSGALPYDYFNRWVAQLANQGTSSTARP